MKISVESRAHRALRHLRNYSNVDLEELDRIYGEELITLSEGEWPIGCYYNYEASKNHSLIITNIGIRTFTAGSWGLIDFDDVRDVSSMLTIRDVPIESVNELFVDLRDGTTCMLTILGESEGSKDVFEFHRFLKAIIRDRM